INGKYFSISGMPFFYENYVNIYGLDITERRRAERSLQETEERFRQLADAMPQLVWTARPDGNVDYYNRRVEEYDGFTRIEENIWEWSPVLHPDDIEDTQEEWQSAVETGEVYQIEHRVRMANGTYRWHLSRGVPYIGEDGKILKWFGTATDIHVQKEVEESLRLSERRLRRLVDANIIGVIYRRADGKVYEANDFFLQLIDSSREELEAGKVNWREITPPEYWPIDDHAINESRAYGSCKPYEKEYIRKDGSRVPILIGTALLDNSTDDFVAFIMDLSELKEAQKTTEEYAQRLERSNQELENFAFIASHDMQEPLRKIISFGDRLKMRLKDYVGEEDLEFLKRMQDASRRMQIMIDDLLELSRVSTHGHPFTPVDLNTIASDVLLDLEYRLRESGGEVVLEDLPEIEADGIQMHHLLQNLIGNAIKYRKPGLPAQVKVSASVENNGKNEIVQIFVEDNGIGFDEIHKDKIFQVFERLVGRSEYEGSGMGLAICKKIVERHGGTITARSQPEVGSTFIVTLPVRQYS
ncbi:MAG: PAS domain S-box protein, partial [Chloroflexi bacterium]